MLTRGHRVVAVARRKSDALQQASRDVAARGTGVLLFRPFDLGEVGAISEFVSALRTELGQIHGLVNNAGLGTGGLLAMMPDAEIQALIKLNTLSPISDLASMRCVQ